MLLQSEYQFSPSTGKVGSVSVELLPALPAYWKDGSVSGIRARGGITVDMMWRDSRVTELTLMAQQAQKIQLTVNGELKQLKLKKGRNVIKLS
jgi:alpha-L-fucosidase 2